MRIYYFNGNKIKGIDLINNLEDISKNLQKKNLLRRIKLPLKILRRLTLQKLVDFANNLWNEYYIVTPNKGNIEGEYEDQLYYLHKYIIKWCKKRSLKGFFIRLVGVNIEKSYLTKVL